jgi:predicted nucleotidyltransferase
MLAEGDIARIARKIADGYGPLLVGVFGSYAVGRAHEGSDLDLVIVKETGESPAARRRNIHRLLFGFLYPVDAPVYTPREFEDAAHQEMSFPWVIARQARIYHWTADAPRLVPSLAARMVPPGG